MHRLRLCLPPSMRARYRYLDLMHDALVNGWLATGAKGEEVVGSAARPWCFAALGFHSGQSQSGRENQVHTLVVSTPDPLLAGYLRQFDPATVRKTRSATGEAVDFAGAEVIAEVDPVAPNQGQMSVLMLSPLAVRDAASRRWWDSLTTNDFSAAINTRLSRLAGRPVRLTAIPDSLYLRANPRHSVLVPLKGFANGHISFVIGLEAPLLLIGSDDDLRLAWYAGLGEKNRNGFGCVGLATEGIGR